MRIADSQFPLFRTSNLEFLLLGWSHVAEARKEMTPLLSDIAASITSPVEARLFAEYGAIFLTSATPPPTIIFASGSEVDQFQSSLSVWSGKFGEHMIELQALAIEALNEAAADLSHAGKSLSARAPDAGRRSYDDTVRLWSRNVGRGLEHWEGRGRITAENATAIGKLPPVEQVGVILELEDKEIYFGTYFDRSILSSVAAPGASQPLSLLAFDVAEYQDPEVERAMERKGWFRTVVSDLPHFTYLGRREDELNGLGLKRVVRGYGDTDYHFWVPDLAVSD